MVHSLHSRGVRLENLPALSIVQLHPVILAILHLSGALQRLCEEFAQVVIVGRVFEAEVADIAEVLIEFLCKQLVFRHSHNRDHRTREAVTKILDWRCLLLLANLLILLLVGGSLQSLPWKATTQEVHENMA